MTRPTRQGWIVVACAVGHGAARPRVRRARAVRRRRRAAHRLRRRLRDRARAPAARSPCAVGCARRCSPPATSAASTSSCAPTAAGLRPSFELIESVGADRTARMAVSPMRGGRQKSAGYRVPTERRGVLTIGPLVALRSDLLGLARSVDVVAGVDEILVAPRAFELPMPELGDGILGRHLLVQSVRLGPGEFHSLREYVPGDEPRTIHWRASARSDDLKVRQYSAEGLRRCTVVLDQQVPRGAAPRRGVRAGGRRRGEPRPQRRPARTADPLRHHRRRRPARSDRLGAHDAPPRQGDARPAAATPDRARSRRGSRPRVPDHAEPRLRCLAHAAGDARPVAHRARRVHRVARAPCARKLFVDARSETALLDSWAGSSAAAERPSYLKVNPLAGKQAAVDDPVQRDDGARRHDAHGRPVAPRSTVTRGRRGLAPVTSSTDAVPRPTSATSRSASTSPPRSG